MDPDVLANTKAIREYEMATKDVGPEKVGGRGVAGFWSAADPRRAFVEGASWWMYHTTGFTAFASERDEMEKDAERRFARGDWPTGDEVESLRSRVSLLKRERDEALAVVGFYESREPGVIAEHDALRAELSELRTKYEEARRALDSVDALIGVELASWEGGHFRQAAEVFAESLRCRIQTAALGTPEGTGEKQ